MSFGFDLPIIYVPLAVAGEWDDELLILDQNRNV
jgi:hypothetical protein